MCYITGVNCDKNNATDEMLAVKNRFGKTDRNLAMHGYQSFKPGEVDADTAHKIGVELAESLWGKRYQVIVSTHLDKNHLHNHFVINSVSFVDGKKIPDKTKTYHDMRAMSDEICARHNLSVLKKSQNKTPRSIYFAEKDGEPTRYNLMREAIDFAIDNSTNNEQFFKILQKQGYGYDFRSHLKYQTIKAKSSSKSTRLYRLGDEYLPERIYERIKINRESKRGLYNQYFKPDVFQRKVYKINSFTGRNKVTGLRALYFHYCYLLGFMKKNNKRKSLSHELREDIRRIDRYSKQVRLLHKKDLNTEDEVKDFVLLTEKDIDNLVIQRQSIYNKLRRCVDEIEIQKLKSQRDIFSKSIKDLRADLKISKSILEDVPKIKANISIENGMKKELLKPKERQRGYYR